MCTDFKSQFFLSAPLAPSFPFDQFGNEFRDFGENEMFPVFCKSSEVGLIGKLDVQKGRVFGLNNQSSDRHTNITTTHNTEHTTLPPNTKIDNVLSSSKRSFNL